ncbi:hypothetical protein A3Q36_16025 [Geobacillus stearothermophilus]|nr:hypothetical protein A3Q36_16025 [Geobacillus stearothermophilus]
MIKKIKTAFFLFIPHISLSNIAIMFVFKSQVHLLVMNHFSLLMTFVIAIGLIFPFPNLTDAHKGTEEFHDCECGNKEVVEKPEGFEILEENKVRQAYSSLHLTFRTLTRSKQRIFYLVFQNNFLTNTTSDGNPFFTIAGRSVSRYT